MKIKKIKEHIISGRISRSMTRKDVLAHAKVILVS